MIPYYLQMLFTGSICILIAIFIFIGIFAILGGFHQKFGFAAQGVFLPSCTFLEKMAMGGGEWITIWPSVPKFGDLHIKVLILKNELQVKPYKYVF